MLAAGVTHMFLNVVSALELFLPAIALAAVVGFLLVPAVGDRYLRVVGSGDYPRLSVAVLCLLVVVYYLFAAWVGVLAALVGLVPARFGAKRAHLMGVLLVPLML